MQRAKNCHCGGISIITGECTLLGSDDSCVYVACDKCHMRGPKVDSPELAIMRWDLIQVAVQGHLLAVVANHPIAKVTGDKP